MSEHGDGIVNGDCRAGHDSESISEYVQEVVARNQGVVGVVQDGTQHNYFMDLPDPRVSTEPARDEEPEGGN